MQGQENLFSIESVRKAIQILFTSQEYTPSQTKEADEFLKQFGKSQSAWIISIQILSQFPNDDNTLLFQMARILRTKWQYDYVTLNPQSVKEVYDQSLAVVKQYAPSSERAIRIQMALILIYIYMQTFEQWGNNDILSLLLNEMNFTQEVQLNSLLKFGFDVIENWPDEILENDKIVIDQKKKKQLTQLIKQQSMSRVFELLQKLWPNSECQYHILRCYKSWIIFVKRTLNQQEVQQFLRICNECPVFAGALGSLLKEELQEKAIQVVQGVMSLVPKEKTQHLLINETSDSDLRILNQLVQKILEAAYQTFPQCRLAIKEEIGEEIQQYVQFYAKLSKRFILQILLLPQLTEPFLSISLFLFHSEQTDEFTEEMRDLWGSLFQALKNLKAEQPAIYGQLMLQLSVFFEFLIKACVQKSRVSVEYLEHYTQPKIIQKDKITEDKNQDQEDGEVSDPEDYKIEQMNEQYEIKKETRKHVKEIIENMTKAMEPKQLVLHLAQLIKDVGFIFQSQDTQFKDLSKEVQVGWGQFEACLFLTNSIIPPILKSEDNEGKLYLVEIMYIYLTLKQTNSFIVKTTLKTIAEGGAALLQVQKDLLQRVFDYVYKHLDSPKKSVQSLASKAFAKICQFNHDFVLQNLQVFISMLKNMNNGVAQAVCSSNAMIIQYFVPLCSVFAQNLVVLQQELEGILIQSSQNGQTPKQVKKQHISILRRVRKNLDAITMTVNKIEQDESIVQVHQLVVQIYRELWPILSFLVEHISKIDDNIAEKVVRLTKHTWRCTFKSFDVQFLTEVLKKFIECYKQQPISSFIYATEIIATVYHKYDEYRNVLLEAFEMICDITFMHLPQLQSFEDNPELCEDFFGMLQRYGKYQPQLLLQSKSLDSILKLTEIGIGVQHHHAAKSIYGWLEVLAKFLSKNTESIFKSPFSPTLLQNLKFKLNVYLPIYMQKIFKEIRDGISDEEVAVYVYDVIAAISNIDQIDYQCILRAVLNEGEAQVLTSSERDEWLNYMNSRTYDDRQEDQQKHYLELLNRRSIQHSMRE